MCVARGGGGGVVFILIIISTYSFSNPSPDPVGVYLCDSLPLRSSFCRS